VVDVGARAELRADEVMRCGLHLGVILMLLAGAPAVRAAVPSDAEDLGPCADADATGPLLLVFPPRDAAALDALLAEQADPHGPRYRRWITPEQFGERFGVGAVDYAAAVRWLRRRGFAGIHTWPGRLAIAFQGTVGQVAHAFRTPMRAYRWHGALHMAPERAAVLPAFGSARPALLGLDGFVRVQPGVRVGTADRLGPGDVYVAHGVGQVHSDGFTGRGVTIAVLAVSDFAISDVALFRSTFGVAPGTVIKRFPGGNPGLGDFVSLGEVLLDTEWSGAIAPGATIVAEIAASANAASFAAAALDAVNHDVADVLSVSFGVCEPIGGSVVAQEVGNLTRQAAAQGMSVFVSSGDDGVATCRRQNGSLAPAVNVFAASPYVTAVGGTQLDPLFDAAGNATGYGGETVWNDTAAAGRGAGGGGQSTFFGKPSYQDLPGIPADGARDVPDVAFAASPRHPGFALVYGGIALPNGVGGTSASAPVWAGMAALLVQKRGGRLGLLNGALYELGSEQARGVRAPVFHDVTVGDVGLPGVPGPAAAPGYDLATGWGSFDAPALLAAFDPGPACQADGDCDDRNPCTLDHCTPAGCRHGAVPDGSACRTLDCATGTCAAGGCAATGAAGCDDGDPCTDDVCASQGFCVRSVTIGGEAVSCVFAGGAVVAPECTGERVPRALGRRVARAERLLGRTQGANRASLRLVDRAGRQLRKAGHILAYAANRLAPSCHTILQGQVGGARAQLAHLRRLLAP
jgi:Pro-kumamolisin, activation domain/Subtilase family/Dictyostelium (slime mold) repeat